MVKRTVTKIRRMAATAMPMPKPALAPTDIPPEEDLLTRDDIGKEFTVVAREKARRGAVRLRLEGMIYAWLRRASLSEARTLVV